MSCSSTDSFISNPRVLLCNPLSVFPSADQSPNEQINSVVRLLVYLGGLLSIRMHSFKPILAAVTTVIVLQFTGAFDAFFQPPARPDSADVADAKAEDAKSDETAQVVPSQSELERMAQPPAQAGRRVTIVPDEATKQYATRPPVMDPPLERPNDVDSNLQDSGLTGVLAHGGKSNHTQNY
jgi:hypothetical protein